ncbi:MAG: DUF5696 domain-containing protein [Bacilli bacterium]
MMEKEPMTTYRPLPWYKNIWINWKSGITNYIRNYRFPWKKLIIVLVLAFIVLTVYLAVVFSQVIVPERLPYDKTAFIDAPNYIDEFGQETVIENDDYRFVLNNNSTTFTITDKSTNEVWSSNPNTSSKRFLEPLIVYYAGSLGAASSMGALEKAVDFKDYYFRKQANSLEILYEIGGKKDVDRTDFPEIMTNARMEEKILSKLEEGSIAYRRVTEQMYTIGELKGEQVWKLKDGITVVPLRNLYKIFYEDCGYTKEDLQYDLQLSGIVYEDIYPYVEIALRYTITDDGFTAEVINESIFEKAKYPLVYLDLLPFFGCATTTDTGYTLIPDGSGVIIDFNNNRSFAMPYQQRVYGKELAVNTRVKENAAEKISFPVFGMKRNNEGFIAIGEDGVEMASMLAKTSTEDSPYNQAYYRYQFRESEVFEFTAINSSTNIVKWTDWYSLANFKVNYQFLHEDSGSYTAMANKYRQYLLEKQMIDNTDETTKVMLDLTLLGGYVDYDNFIGIPYSQVRSLTNVSQVEQIIEELTLFGLTDLRVIYSGWGNDGIKPTFMGNIQYNRLVGQKDQLEALADRYQTLLYLEANIAKAYTGTSFNEKELAVRDVFGKMVVNYAYDEATLYADQNTMSEYLLKPTTYNKTLVYLHSAYQKLGVSNISLTDFGSQMYGSYEKKETILRTDTLDLIEETSLKLNDFNNVIVRNPNVYGLKNINAITDLVTYGTNYQIVEMSVPFVQLVLSGLIDYSAKSFNLDDRYSFEWHKMKAIETASNISLTWSFEPTIKLTDTEYSHYYSTYYQNWLVKAIMLQKEMEQTGVYETYLVKHESLNEDGSVTKSTYANGLEIIFNYSLRSYTYGFQTINSQQYQVVKGANV